MLEKMQKAGYLCVCMYVFMHVYVCFSGKYFKNVKIYTEHINSEDKEEIMFVPDENDSSGMVSWVCIYFLETNVHFINVIP